MLLIDTSTGTVLTASTCVLVPDDALTESEWEELDTMSDSEVSNLARERGIPVLNAQSIGDTQELNAIFGVTPYDAEAGFQARVHQYGVKEACDD